jgi:hypothetical protein
VAQVVPVKTSRQDSITGAHGIFLRLLHQPILTDLRTLAPFLLNSAVAAHREVRDGLSTQQGFEEELEGQNLGKVRKSNCCAGHPKSDRFVGSSEGFSILADSIILFTSEFAFDHKSSISG